MAEEAEQGFNLTQTTALLIPKTKKFKIGDDFDLFVKKSEWYFQAVELTDEKIGRFSLYEDAFLAEIS